MNQDRPQDMAGIRFPVAPLADNTLSGSAYRVIYAVARAAELRAGQPGAWVALSVEDIAALVDMARGGVSRVIATLEVRGYLDVRRSRDERGKFSRSEYRVAY